MTIRFNEPRLTIDQRIAIAVFMLLVVFSTFRSDVHVFFS
jgi:hypothetical protein